MFIVDLSTVQTASQFNIRNTHGTLLHVDSSKRHNFVTVLTSLELFVLTCAKRTRESSPQNTFVMRPNNQRHRGTVLSSTGTGSFTPRSVLFGSHLWRYCSVATYSGIYRHQKQLGKNSACFHCLREYRLSSVKKHSGTAMFPR